MEASKTTRNRRRRKPMSPESQENRMISLAMDLTEQRLREGTATSQEIVHFLKLGTEKSQLEKEKLEEENKLLRAKTESLQSQQTVEELYIEALEAMRDYGGKKE